MQDLHTENDPFKILDKLKRTEINVPVEKTQCYSNVSSLQFDIESQQNHNPNFQLTLFVEIYRLILKYTWKCKWSRISQVILIRESKVGEFALPNFKACYKTGARSSRLYDVRRETCHSVGQNREPRNRPTFKWSFDFSRKNWSNSMDKTVLFNRCG